MSNENTTRTEENAAGREASELSDALGAPAGYSCWQMLTVKSAAGLNRVDGCIPLILLPKSLIGKTVKVTIEECT